MSKELLEQAIETLERLKAESTQGEWGHYQDNEHYSTISPVDDVLYIAHVGLTPVDGELIVTLHRTIDAQIEILCEALTGFVSHVEDGFTDGDVVYCSELSLAKAILGVE